MVVDCEDARDENGMPTKVQEDGKILYVTTKDSEQKSVTLKVHFKLDIDIDTINGVDKATATFASYSDKATSATLTLSDPTMTSEKGEIYLIIRDDTNTSLPVNWGNSGKHFTNEIELKACEFDYNSGKLDIHLYSTIYINTCDYSCWISYDKYGVPNKIELGDMIDCSNAFSDSNSTILPWALIDKSDSDSSGGLFAKFEGVQKATSMCHASRCSRFKVNSEILENMTSIASHTTNMFEFDVKTGRESNKLNASVAASEVDANKEAYMSDSLTNVVIARHAFIHCYPNLEGTINRMMEGNKSYGVLKELEPDQDPEVYTGNASSLFDQNYWRNYAYGKGTPQSCYTFLSNDYYKDEKYWYGTSSNAKNIFYADLRYYGMA